MNLLSKIYKKIRKYYSNPSFYAVTVASQRPHETKFVLYKSQYRQKKLSENFFGQSQKTVYRNARKTRDYIFI